MISKQSWLRNLLLLAMASASFCVAGAQSTTQGAIAGTVEDATNAAIPSAVVTIHNDGTNADTKLTSDASGYFKAPLLEPGMYTVTVSATGFAGYVAKTVVVEVGKLTQVMPHMTAGAAETTVQVTADQPILNYESADMSAVLNRTAVDNIPSFSKRWSSLTLMTPGATVDTNGYGLVQIRGISPLLNNVQIDGADDNQAYFSEERGRTREGYSTSPNAVREFEVNTGVYSAQFGRAAGGVINSVTRSGSNNFHGELFFSDVDRGFGAYQPGNNDAFGHPLKPNNLRKIYGGAVGGYLIKDKLFFFYTYDQLASIIPGVAKVANYGGSDGQTVGSFLEQPDGSAALGSASCNTTTGTITGANPSKHATLDSQVCAYAARLGYTYDTAVANYNARVSGAGGLTSDLGLVPRTGFQAINTPKIDWQITPTERASFVYHRLRWDSPGGVQTASTANYSVDAFGNDFVKLDYGVAKLTSTFGSKLSNEILFQYGRELNDESQQPYSAYTLTNLIAKGNSASGFVNGPGGTIPYLAVGTASNSTQFNLGSPYYSYRTAYPDERKWQIEDTLYYSLGNHSIRAGADFLHNYDFVNQTPYYFGYYQYSTLSAYFSDLDKHNNGVVPGSGTDGCGTTTGGSGLGTAPCFTSYNQEFGAQTAFDIATLDQGYFVQDNWKATPRLTLELGVRYDYEHLPNAIPNFTTATGSFVPFGGITNHPSDKNNVGVRIGFSYDPFGDGKTVVRGGYGIYYGRIINATLGSVFSQTGSPNAQTYVSGLKPSSLPNLVFPYTTAPSTVKPSSYFLAPNLQNPQVHEFDLQLQRDLGRGHVFQISYLGALGRELPNFLDVNLAPPTSTVSVQAVGGPIAGVTFTNPLFTGYINSNFSDITEVISNVNSSYNALVVEIQNRSFHGLQYDFNYTWSHALDFNQNATAGTGTNSWLNPYANQRQNYGNSAFNVGNRVAGYVLYHFPKVHFGGSTGWMNYVANGWMINSNFQMQNGLPYSANLGSQAISTAALKTGSVTGAPSVTYIPAIGLNTFQVPRVILDDLRLQKSFAIREKYTLELNADMYNVANHQNFSPSNLTTTAYNVTTAATPTSTGTITYNPQSSPYSGFGSHSASNNSGFSYIPREFQIGARLQF